MSQYAIHAEALSKEYVIGAQKGYRMLREELTRGITAPFQRIWRRGGIRSSNETIWALKDISFTVAQGKVVGIIGRNGAGKSTLMKILSRITMPTEGQVAVRGRVASLLEVGTGFHPELTGRENIFLNGAILGMTRKEVQRKFDEILDFAGVERFVDTPVKHYSSGMAMRLAFAIAAHLEADILLVDEVLAVGDASFQKKCLATMQNVAVSGRTVLFVSHNMSAVQALCERVMYLSAGKIIGDGDPRMLIEEYLRSTTLRENKSKQLRVGEALTIANMALTPNPVQAGSDLRFELDVQAHSQVWLSEAALVMYAIEGPRVGIIDLRSTGFPFRMEAGETLRVEGVLESLPLVERQYRFELYINSSIFVGDVADLADLNVLPAAEFGAYAHYPPHLRGWTEFRTKCSSHLCRKIEPLAETK